MDAQFKNIQAQVGEELLPVLNEVSDWMSSPEGKEYIKDAIEVMKEAIGYAKEFFGWLKDVRDIFNSPNGQKAFNAMDEFYGGNAGKLPTNKAGVKYNTFNVNVQINKTDQPAETIVREVKKLTANNGRNYLFR